MASNALNALLHVGILLAALLRAGEADTYVNPTPLAHSEVPPSGATSLAFVFDKTGSMYDDLQQVRSGAKRIFETVFRQHRRLIHNYVLVAFHDPEIDPPFVSSDPIAFQAELGRVHVNGGGDCPEMTLGGIKKALEVSLPASYIYVFTDALSKDYHLEDQVVGLIQQKQSSVVFVMTGDCGNRTHPGYIVFEKIAAASFGQVFHLTKADVKTVLEYVRTSIAQRKVHVLYEVRERGGSNQRAIPVDEGMSELTLSLAGQREDGDFLEMTLIDPKGNKVDRSQYANESGTIDLRNVKLMKISDPVPGIWRIHTSSRLKHTLRIFGHGTIDFTYGFAAKPVSRIELTHKQPVANQHTYLHVNMTALLNPGRTTEISLVDFHGKVLYSSKAKRDKAMPHMFYVGPFVPPADDLFFVKINGEDDKGFEFQRIAPTSVSSIKATGPRAYMAETTTTTILGSVNLTCSVESRSPFTVHWKRGGQIIGGPLFYQSSEVAIWPLHQVTQSDRGSYECVVTGEHGNHTAKTFLDTREPPPYISALRDESVIRDQPAFLHCQTQSSERVMYEWRKNGRIVGNTSRMAVYPNGTVHIYAAAHTDEGQYECHVRTPGGATSAVARLTVLDRPFASVTPKSVHFVPSREFKLSCDVSGSPRPETQWFFKGKRLIHDHKHYITYRGELIVRSANSEDVGVYECRAVNPAGEATDFSSVYLAVPPKVRMIEGRKMYGRGEPVAIDCQVVSGSPKPKVTWFRGGHTLQNNKYVKITGESRLTIQGVRETDAGNYSCVAENIAGRDSATTYFEVGTVPTIVGLSEMVRAHIERKLVLPCRAIGHPAPSIEWKRDGVPVEQIDGLRYNVLSDGSLRINSVLMEDQTFFMCTAKNDFGSQDKRVHVVVEGLVSPVLSHVSPEAQMIQGQDLRLSCHILIGTPKPRIEWYRNGKPLQESLSVIIQGGGTSLILRGGRPEDEGLYTCAASNAGGNATVNINVQLIKKPTIAGALAEPEEVAAQNGESLRIPCEVTAYPRAAVEWTIDGRPISSNSAEYTIAPDFALHIHKLSDEHVGTFVCHVKNAAGEAQKATIVEVHTPPVIVPAQTSYNLIKGESVVLPCEVKVGKPYPEITWYFEDEVFTEGHVSEDGSLFIDGIDERRRGKFKCVAKNKIGKDERVVRLTVHTAPHIEGSGTPKTIILKVNDSAHFPCPANSHPPPRRTWSYEGQRIYRTVHLGSRIQYPTDGSFVLESVQIKHSGTYTCHVSNLAGNDSITYHLMVQEPPRIVSDIPDVVDVVRDLYLEIPCRAIGIPDPQILWEKDGFTIVQDEGVVIDADGTLRVPKAELRHRGTYKCVAKNVAGSDERVTEVDVQEAPVILPKTPTDKEAVEGRRIELRCFVSARPTATITWRFKGFEISPENERFTHLPDGTLVIEEVTPEDLGYYTCRAENTAGFDEAHIRLTVLSVPAIPEQDRVNVEAYTLGDSFSLYCPVVSNPVPDIFWEFDGLPVAFSSSKHIVISDDRRRLHVNQSRESDAGVYKCVARNKAGESSKSFKIDIHVPPQLDESKFKRQIRAREDTSVEIGCPVSGTPKPQVTWFVDGIVVDRLSSQKGMLLSEDGERIEIESVKTFNEGRFVCYTTNDAGSLDIDIELIVLADPKVGEDESVEVKSGQQMTLVCAIDNDDEKTSVVWLFNGRETLPENVQVPHNKRRLFILNASPATHRGIFECRVRNTVGSSTKTFDLVVLEAPEFVDPNVESAIQLVLNGEKTLSCAARGFPEPTVEWRRHGEPVVEGIEQNGHELRVVARAGAASSEIVRYTCEAKNSVGVVSRDFFVQRIMPPEKASDAADQDDLEVIEGHAISFVCPIVSLGEDLEIEWFKEGKPIEDDQRMTVDRIRLVVVNAKADDHGVYTCVAKNAAGQATHSFDLGIISPPKVEGSPIEEITVLEGEELELSCIVIGDPKPEISWTMRGAPLESYVELFNDNQFIFVKEVTAEDRGNYVCHVRNKAGVFEKTFAVDVITKPRFESPAEVILLEGHLGGPFTLECHETTGSNVEITWMRDEIPIASTVDGPRPMAGGKHLFFPHLDPEDDGIYACVARNRAGEDKQKFKLNVLVPPRIVGEGGKHTVIENNSLVLPCEVEGNPRPTIAWTKDGRPTESVHGVQILNNGQQFKILSAHEDHRGIYQCTASNKISAVDISFEIDVITRPTLSEDVEDTIEVDQRENAYFSCPIQDKNFQGQITWMRNFEPITVDGTKYHLSKSATRLHLLESQVEDEGTYSCVVKNDAGETRIDYRLIVDTPPVIRMLEKDKNRTVVENSTVTISCLATGKPEPSIEWYKDGELLVPENITQKVQKARIEEAGIVISAIRKVDSGRYTCEAKNKAGIADQDVTVSVITIPIIEREGIPSEVNGELEKRLTMSCPAYGIPPPTVTWLKAGKPLEDENHIYFSANGQKLHFIRLSRDDAAKYTCIAKNAAGEDKRDFVLRLLEEPKIEGPNIMRRIQTNAGRTATISCPATGSPEPTISWLRNGRALEKSESERFVLLNGGRQLQIVDTRASDAARYTCIATNLVGAADLDALLTVVSKPTIEGKATETKEIVLKQAFYLLCQVEGTQPIDIEWLRDGRAIETDSLKGGNNYLQISMRGKKLDVLSAKREDEGRVSCVARNDAGEVRKHFDLTLLVPPSINDSLSSEPMQTVIPGHAFNITCRVDATPEANIEWTHEGKVLETSPGGPFEVFENGMLLSVRARAQKDVELFVCRASNKAGTASREFFVRTTGPPVLDQGTQTEKQDVSVDEFVVLTCKVLNGAGNVSVQWFFADAPIEEASELTKAIKVSENKIEIRSVRLSDSGKYTCVVKNEAGEARKTYHLNVQERPRFFDPTNTKSAIIIGRPLILDCAVSGTPKPTVSWRKDGSTLQLSDNVNLLNDGQQLHIEEATEEDAGRYSCIAENLPGRAEKDLTVSLLRAPTSDVEEQQFEAEKGESHTFVCPIRDFSGPIQWTKDGLPIITSKHVQLSGAGSKLHLLRVDSADNGAYLCSAANEAGEAEATIHFVVLEHPTIEGSSYRTMTAILNETVRVDCDVTGTPPPKIDWLFDGFPVSAFTNIEIDEEKNILRILNVEKAQEGRYTCVATNKVGKVEMDTFLDVHEPPTIKGATEEIKVREGNGKSIRCEVEGSPRPQVQWRKNGAPYESPLSHVANNAYSIHLQRATVADSGVYTCVATNSAGVRQKEFRVHVLVPPKIDEGERVLKVKENGTVTLECIASGVPPPTITWRRDGRVLSTESHFELPNVEPKDAGRYSCEARNEADWNHADFNVDVLVKPRFRADILKSEIRVIEGENAMLECRAEGKPTPAVRWMRGGRPITDSANVILSPRSESLMILHTRRSDAGVYSCIVTNAAGQSEATFKVTVLAPPHIDETIDQNPRVIHNRPIVLQCPVLGNPAPEVEWRYNGAPIELSERVTVEDKKHLKIENASTADAGRYTCHAENEVSDLDTHFILDVIAPPKFGDDFGKTEYEVLKGEDVTMTCPVRVDQAKDINWMRGNEPLYLSDNVKLSSDAHKLTLEKVEVLDGGKFACRASNEAGSTEVHLILKVLVPPEIDKSNIIQNPLAILARSISLECPVKGIPQPSVLWLRDNVPVAVDGKKYLLDQSNQTFVINDVGTADQGAYSCFVENRGGATSQDFNLGVLIPPIMETNETQAVSKREGSLVMLTCPVQRNPSEDSNPMEISWLKDGRPIDPITSTRYNVNESGRRLLLAGATLSDAGNYVCIASNQAGEVYVKFDLEILSVPSIDNSRNDPKPRVIEGRPITLWCEVSGYPFPAIRWSKNGILVDVASHDDHLRLLDDGQGLEILEATPEDAGQWMCTAENDAGAKELILNLDVWTAPAITVTTLAGDRIAISQSGSPVTLICNATGNPKPMLSWSFGGQMLIPSADGAHISSKGGRLDIPHLRENDAGLYTCSARNEVGSVEESIDVDILIPPVINRNNIDLNPRIPTGRSLTLVCEASGKPTPSFSWFLNDAPLANSSTTYLSDDSNYLQLRNISLVDRGVYYCEARNDAGFDRIMYKLDVDQIPVIMNGGTVQVTEGQITEMVCQAQGEPAPVVTWQRNGIRVETGIRYIAEGDVLKVIDTRTADSGIYVCVATNEAGIDQQAFTLEVLVPPRITITSPSESMVPVGMPFSLKCGASGSPPPEITWYLNDAAIESVYAEDEFTLAEDGTLFIPRPNERGGLPFKCVVRNDAGSAEIEYLVKVISPPTVSRDGLHTLNITEGDTSTLLCQIEGENSNIVWRKDNEPLALTPQMNISSGGAHLEIANTKLHDEGLYTCIAVNSAGNATQNIQLFVGVPPKISEKARRIVVRKGQNAELWCEAVGIPPPQISWLKNNDPLVHTAVDDHTERIQTTALFNEVTLEDAGIYTCTAKNWAGSVYKDVDLVVLNPPEIFPEKMNLTANINETIILPCNASGIPEPVVSWVKIPDVDISGHAEKYQLLGTALAIKNVGPEDDGFYHCIAKSDAGQVIGLRRLIVPLPSRAGEPKIHWVDCDEEGKPVRKTYVPTRGDAPQGTLLPWATTDFLDLPQNGTDGILIKCMPGVRGPRRVPLLSVPHFTNIPRSHQAVVGQVLQLYCSATGTPEPEMTWLKDGTVILDASSGEGSSLMRLEVVDESVAGRYTCVARNSLGTSTTMATVSVIPKPKKKTVPVKRQVTVMRCSVDGKVGDTTTRPDWVIDGRRIDENEGIQLVHAMNNSSLVLLADAEEEDSTVVECYVDGRRGMVSSTRREVDERAPKAVIRPARIYSRPGKTILINCRVKYANLLTTQVRWTKDNVNLALDDGRVQILPNNSLWISEVRHTDQASYKCRAANRLGKSWDGVDVIIDDGSRGAVGVLGGMVNQRKVTHQNLVANVTPHVGFNSIQVKIDNLYGNHDTVTKAIIGYIATPVQVLGYDPEAPTTNRGNFERLTEYRFETGETINVKQKGNGVQTENSHLGVDVLINGNVPRPAIVDTVAFEDSEEELIEEVPGMITGRGKSALQFGDRHRVPFEWSDKINYDPREGMEIGAGNTKRVRVKSHFDNDELQMHAKVDRDDRCPEGFHKIRGYCKDIDECAMDEEICGEESECVNTDGGYECERQCPAGFRTKWDGSCVDIDECGLGTATCPFETECLNTIGSFKCLESCAAGYELNEEDECQDINECAALTDPCKSPMSCKNTLGSYRCVCPAGFPVVDGKCHGISAESERPLQTLSFEEPLGGDCPPGFHWTGFVCEDVDECAFDAPCQFECENTVGSYKCFCPEGYLLDEQGKCIDIDECVSGVCTASQLCFNELGSFKCLNSPCPQGYHLNNMRCVSNCANCSYPPIAIHMLAVPRRIPRGTPLLRLTSYDTAGRVLHRTRFNLSPKARAHFALSFERGRATLLNSAKLAPSSRHSIGIRSFSDARDKKYQSDFLVLLAVSKYDF